MAETSALLAFAKQLATIQDDANCEMTSFPHWAIVKKIGGSGSLAYLAGPWFSRDTAEAHLKMFAYRFPKGSFVYCFSGSESRDYRALLTAAREASE